MGLNNNKINKKRIQYLCDFVKNNVTKPTKKPPAREAVKQIV